MRKDTRLAYNGYLEQIAKLNDVVSASEKFTVEPSVQQTLESKMQESTGFLGKINVVGVPEQQGDKLGLGVGSPIAGTTNTTLTDRTTTDITTLDEVGYICTQTNFDTHISYSKLDAWAKFKDFQERIRNAILTRQALDRIMIGFNGTIRAATSDKGANPLLQDVNKGWLQKIIENAPERVLTAPTVGAGGDFENIDALVFDMVNSLIEPWYQEDTELVAVVGRKLLADKYFPIINSASNPPTEQLAGQVIMSQKRIGNLPAVRVPFFPADSIMVTRLDNLSIYFQEGSRRRNIVDNSKRDRIENYESSNDAYVVEDHGLAALAKGITEPEEE